MMIQKLCIALVTMVLVGPAAAASTRDSGNTSAMAPNVDMLDADQDGVRGAADLCPDTTAGAILVDGCSALDLARKPQRLLQPAENAIAAARDAVRPNPLLKGVADRLDRSLGSLKAARPVLADAKFCDGAALVGEAVARADEAHTLMRSLLPQLRAATGAGDDDPRVPSDSHDGNEVPRLVAIDFALDEVAQAVPAVQRTSRGIGAACSAVAGPSTIRGRIVEIHDAARLMRLEGDGAEWIGLPPGLSNLAPDMDVQITGTLFNDATAWANHATVLDGLGEATSQKLSCIHLRIAPVQGFAPYFMGPYTLHQPNGYRVSQRLLLEHGAGLAAEQSCDSGVTPGRYRQYSLSLDLEYVKPGETFTTTVNLANWLENGDHPVFLPDDLDYGSDTLFPRAQAALRVTPRYRECTLLGCGPVHATSPVSYSLQIARKGTLARVAYDTTFFALEDDDVTGWRPAAVTAVHSQFPLPPTGIAFQALGCGIVGGSSSCDGGGALVPIQQNVPFAIYNDAAQVLFPVETRGVARWSGLSWPRVAGVRNGQEFWYSADVPRLTRDVVDFCPVDAALHEYAAHHSLYRMPFYPGYPYWSSGNGTVLDADDHCDLPDGTDEPYATCIQRWAHDLGCDVEGREIRAARGGIVSFVKEDETLPHGDCVIARSLCETGCGGNQACLDQCKAVHPCTGGNHLFIRHQDDTYAQYSHLAPNGVLAQLGQVVRRGDVIGLCGETGYASGPHLHFHVQPKPGFDSSNSIAARFQTEDKTCTILRVGETLNSTNHPALW